MEDRYGHFNSRHFRQSKGSSLVRFKQVELELEVFERMLSKLISILVTALVSGHFRGAVNPCRKAVHFV